MFRTVGRVPITDDRGRTVDLVQPPDPWPPELRRWTFRRPKIADPALRMEFDCARRTGARYGMAGGLLMYVTGMGVRSSLTTAGVSASWLWIIAPFLAGLTMWPLYRPIGRRVRRSAAADLRMGYIDSGRCVSCGFSLDGLPVEADGMTVCPECGAAWKLKNWSRPSPLPIAAGAQV
jgi:hypothetical protein